MASIFSKYRRIGGVLFQLGQYANANSCPVWRIGGSGIIRLSRIRHFQSPVRILPSLWASLQTAFLFRGGFPRAELVFRGRLLWDFGTEFGRQIGVFPQYAVLK